MATTLLSDTYKAVLQLQQKKFSAEQAQGIVEILNQVDFSHLATKTDVNDLRLELKLDLYKALAAQTVVILGVVIAMFQFLK